MRLINKCASLVATFALLSGLAFAAPKGEHARKYTIVDGKVLMKDRRVRTLDRASVITEANALAAKVRAAVGR